MAKPINQDAHQRCTDCAARFLRRTLRTPVVRTTLCTTFLCCKHDSQNPMWQPWRTTLRTTLWAQPLCTTRGSHAQRLVSSTQKSIPWQVLSMPLLSYSANFLCLIASRLCISKHVSLVYPGISRYLPACPGISWASTGTCPRRYCRQPT